MSEVNLGKNSIVKVVIFLVAAAVLVFFVAGFFNKSDTEVCKCYEVVGDESNFYCYTPDGEIDTKGECVGPKKYE